MDNVPIILLIVLFSIFISLLILRNLVRKGIFRKQIIQGIRLVTFVFGTIFLILLFSQLIKETRILISPNTVEGMVVERKGLKGLLWGCEMKVNYSVDNKDYKIEELFYFFNECKQTGQSIELRYDATDPQTAGIVHLPNTLIRTFILAVLAIGTLIAAVKFPDKAIAS